MNTVQAKRFTLSEYEKLAELGFFTKTIYAKAGISNYWIFNLVDSYLEDYSEPYQDNLVH
jgi:hypothetical protein